MYSQQNTNEKTQPCKDCANNNVLTNIVWRPNPEKPGINPNTGRPYMMPVDVKTGQRHQCQFFKQRQANQTNQMLDSRYGAGSNTVAPKFTPNNQTFENIETNTGRIVSQNEKIIELLELIAGEKIREQGMPRANEIPQEHETYQNNTGYAET